MIAGIQTHIEGWTDPYELRFAYDNRFRMGRIAAMEVAADKMIECVVDTKAAQLHACVTLADAKRIALLKPLFGAYDLVECRNEDDGDISPREYRRILDEFCAEGLRLGVPIGGPTFSNTNTRCVRWVREVRGSGWPKGMVYFTGHSYDPHENREFAAIEALSDGMPIVWSEFGYPSIDGEEDQAEHMRKLWPVYFKYYAALQYQMHSGARTDEQYGIRRQNGQGDNNGWKPAAYTVPEGLVMPDPPLSHAIEEPIVPDVPTPEPPPTEPPPAPKPITMIKQPIVIYEGLSRKAALKHPTEAGYFTWPHPDGDGSVLSVQPPDKDESGVESGTIRYEKRPKGTAGEWESGRDGGQVAIFDKVVKGRNFCILLVD